MWSCLGGHFGMWLFMSGVLTGLVLRPLLSRLVAGGLQKLRRCLWFALRWLRARPRRLWRVSTASWSMERSVRPLRFVKWTCANCLYWDTQAGSDECSRLHGAVEHLWHVRDGMRGGRAVLDRWCSTTTSAAVVIFRANRGSVVHAINVIDSGCTLDLRWLVADTPDLDNLCRECGRGSDDELGAIQASYCRLWGVQLQEVLWDRCAPPGAGDTLTSAPLAEGTFPTWAVDLASSVVLGVYRRRPDIAEFQEADFHDIWALFQEARLARFLESILMS
jgi:hypothetical protein